VGLDDTPAQVHRARPHGRAVRGRLVEAHVRRGRVDLDGPAQALGAVGPVGRHEDLERTVVGRGDARREVDAGA
jgi:hypothetical protein